MTKIQKLTKKEWEDENPILCDGELVYEKDTKRFKIGDGITPYRDLYYTFDPCIPLMYTDLINKIYSMITTSIFSFIITAVIWALLSIINWISGLSFIWQFLSCGIIYHITFIIINQHVKKWEN